MLQNIRNLLFILLTFYATCFEEKSSKASENLKPFTSIPNFFSIQQNAPKIKEVEEFNPKSFLITNILEGMKNDKYLYSDGYTQISMNINEEKNNNTILLGENGTLYFITDYNDTEEIFSSPEIEENSKFIS